MAGNAGSVAPVFHAEGYAATNIYDFYHAIIHNNKLYFCRQDGTIGHEPSGATDEYWFLSLDGNFGDAAKLGGESATQWQAKIDVEKARIDALIALEESSELTDVEKEVNDIKVGADGVTYGSAGTAVREQIASVKSDLSESYSELKETLATETANRQIADSSLQGQINNVDSAVTEETRRATAEEQRIEELFTMPTQEAVNSWLDEHPEATTTVQDHSLTIDKMVVGTLDYVTPQMFGAVGDGVTDDTTAFYNALDYGKVVYLPEGTYLIDFRCVNLHEKVIYGASTLKSVIVQKNSNIPFAQIGVSSSITDLSIRMQKNTQITACIVFGKYEEKQIFPDHRIERVNFNCDRYTVVLHYALHSTGSVGGTVRDIVINWCYIGIWVDMTGYGWLTVHRFENINIYRPTCAGVKISDADNQGQHTQSLYTNVSIMNYIDGAIGFDIASGGATMINPACFIENENGITYSLKLHSSLLAKQTKAGYETPSISGGMLEGNIINQDYLPLISIDQCVILIQQNKQNYGKPYYSVNGYTTKISRDVVQSYDSDTTGIQLVNGTVTTGTDGFGKYIEFTRIDESIAGKIIFNIGSNEKLGEIVTNYPVATFYTLSVVNFDLSNFTQIYDTGLGNHQYFYTTLNRLRVANPYGDMICARTVINDWTEHETYKLHNMQVNIGANAPVGSKIRFYSYVVNFGITSIPN